MKINLNLKNQFNLLLVFIFIGGVCISSLALSRILYQQAEQKLTNEGQILMQMMEEIKYYTSVNLLEIYQQQDNIQHNFQASFVPAYAARQIFSNFKDMEEFRSYKYKD